MEKITLEEAAGHIANGIKVAYVELAEKGNGTVYCQDIHHVVLTTDIPGIGVTESVATFEMDLRYDSSGEIVDLDEIEEYLDQIGVGWFEQMEANDNCLIDYDAINWDDRCIGEITEAATKKIMEVIETLPEEYVTGGIVKYTP